MSGLCGVRLAARQVGQLGQGIDLVGRGLALGDLLQLDQQRTQVALQVVGEVVDPQQLHGPGGGLRAAERSQLQLVDQRVSRRRAQGDPFLGASAGGKQRQDGQQHHAQRDAWSAGVQRGGVHAGGRASPLAASAVLP